MRRLVAALLVASSFAAPVLRAVCELSCGPGAEQTVVSLPSCHEKVSEPAAVSALSVLSALSFDAPDDCGDHAQLPAVTASQKERAGFVQLNLQLFVESSPVAHIGVDRLLTAHTRGSTSPPIPPGTRILRI